MSLTHFVRGYDKTTDRMGAEVRLTAAALSVARTLVSANPDDPALIDPYELLPGQVASLGVPTDPERFVYYLEADEDPHVVAEIRDGVRSAA